MNVQFDEQDQFINNPSYAKKEENISHGSVTDFFIKLGFGKDKKTAEISMVILSIVCVALAIYFFLQ